MPDEHLRLFVAIELPSAAREALIEWRDRAVGRVADLRPLSADSLHATLCFLGWQVADEIGSITAACEVLSGEPAPPLSLGDARWLPPRRPRVLAVELVDRAGALARVQAKLSRALQDGGWYQPEKRPYLGHVTVARMGRPGRAPRDPLPPPPPVEFRASRVILYRSRLLRTGARYEALAAIELE